MVIMITYILVNIVFGVILSSVLRLFLSKWSISIFFGFIIAPISAVAIWFVVRHEVSPLFGMGEVSMVEFIINIFSVTPFYWIGALLPIFLLMGFLLIPMCVNRDFVIEDRHWYMIDNWRYSIAIVIYNVVNCGWMLYYS